MDERQKRIIEKIGEENLIEMNKRMAEVSRRIAEIARPVAIMQNETLTYIVKLSKALPDFSWVDDFLKFYVEVNRVAFEPMRRVGELVTSIRQYEHPSEIVELSRQIVALIGPILDENDQRRKEAEREAEKIPAKFGTVHDKVHTVVDAQMDIRLLKKIEDNCLYLIDKFENCIDVYNDLDAEEFEYDVEQTKSTLQIVRDDLLRCRTQLKDRYVQLELLAEDDAEKQAQIEEVASKIVEEILLPYVSTDPEDVYYVFTPAYAREFLDMEKTLCENGYLNAKCKWMVDRQILATFIETLRVNNYFRHNASSVIIRRRWVREFFEQRYGVKISEQLKPSKVKEYTLPPDFPITFNSHPAPLRK